MRPVISTIFNGQRVVAVGSSFTFIPLKETLHEFFVSFLRSTFSPDWYKTEREKPEHEQHIVAKWYVSHIKWLKQNQTSENQIDGGWSCLPSGASWALLALAYDLYCLAHCLDLPDELVKRLKNKDQFQGARYEIAVAAIFARADFAIDYSKTKENKSCEFIASLIEIDEKIAVEAKSRHRPGILHQEGEKQDIPAIKSGIHRLLNEALAQNPKDIPFIIFLDLNLPPSMSSNLDDKKWVKELKLALSSLGDPSADNPDDFSALFITNYSYHYESDRAINTGAYPADTLTIIPKFPKVPFKNSRSLDKIIAEVNTYGNIPSKWE